MKKLIRLLLISCCIILLTGFTRSETNVDLRKEGYDISELETLPYEKTYSYNEMLELLSAEGVNAIELNNFKEQHLQALQEQSVRPLTRGSEIRYQTFYMKTTTTNYGLWSKCKHQARFTVGLVYYSGSYEPDSIANIGAPHVYTGAGDSCVFTGDIYYQLNNGASFYYTYYGNLYVSGNVNWSVGATVGIGGVASVSFGISNSNGYITNVSINETYSSAGLNP